ncbi:hypothetical protein BDK51DRAFT_52994 [Blyttiomyces helicus]|uniref:Uncharacterized protein n=1 Tax=Blyttiomyces helicus TaxID=388810 RepID=A0A4P9W5G6_9FUNG|nr:hypothetical protein BDK51DRAFT_52994 [Blyttiomyces helicus]|eukprot:RKO86148.1 hypothetical protein BDK51DRAFT_52994 [Blyttiomyces helicus]
MFEMIKPRKSSSRTGFGHAGLYRRTLKELPAGGPPTRGGMGRGVTGFSSVGLAQTPPLRRIRQAERRRGGPPMRSVAASHMLYNLRGYPGRERDGGSRRLQADPRHRGCSPALGKLQRAPLLWGRTSPSQDHCGRCDAGADAWSTCESHHGNAQYLMTLHLTPCGSTAKRPPPPNSSLTPRSARAPSACGEEAPASARETLLLCSGIFRAGACPQNRRSHPRLRELAGAAAVAGDERREIADVGYDPWRRAICHCASSLKPSMRAHFQRLPIPLKPRLLV